MTRCSRSLTKGFIEPYYTCILNSLHKNIRHREIILIGLMFLSPLIFYLEFLMFPV